MMRKILIILFVVLFSTKIYSEDFSIVTNTINKQKSLYRYELQLIFLLNSVYWDNGDIIVPIFLKFDTKQHISFVTTFLNIENSTFKNIVENKRNKGLTQGYFIANSKEEAIRKVKEIQGSIAYVDNLFLIGGENDEIRVIHIID